MSPASKMLVKSPGSAPGLHRIAGPGDAGLRFLEFSVLILGPGFQSYEADTGARELTFDVFAGTVAIEGKRASGEAFRFERVGGRESAFSAPPEMVYLPAGCRFTVRTTGAAKLGIFAAPSKAETAPTHVAPEQALRLTVGKGNWTRNVVTSIGTNVAAERLLVGETSNPPGNWSSAPPHKHDRFVGEAEVPMEEIYYFHVDPPQGFGMMRLYSGADDPEPFDEALVVEDGDTVLIPRGYHPVAAAPGYRVHYTWGMAGDARRYGAWTEDPKHAWVRNVPA